MSIVCILGRQPALGFAELESRFGGGSLSAIRPDIAELKDAKDFDTLGSVLKAGEIITSLETTDFNKIMSKLPKIVDKLLENEPEGKITFGISVYDIRARRDHINAAALSIKKTIKKHGRPARIVPNKESDLNTAQVLHNKLTMPGGIELLLIRHGENTVIARSIWVQDIEAYRRRDQERPFRDPRVGMLPPKLAQVIINLAVGGSRTLKSAKAGTSLNFNETPALSKKEIVLDPFCGTGVILQEALLSGYTAQGTDLDPRMVEYSQKNLEWLGKDTPVAQADATSYTWQTPFTTIACETYLGRPLTQLPDRETLVKIIHDCNVIHKKFLQNVQKQTDSGFRMCIAVPAWRTKSGFSHLPLLDHLKELGYNRVSFVHANTEDLVYHREGQTVARELVVLKRI